MNRKYRIPNSFRYNGLYFKLETTSFPYFIKYRILYGENDSENIIDIMNNDKNFNMKFSYYCLSNTNLSVCRTKTVIEIDDEAKYCIYLYLRDIRNIDFMFQNKNDKSMIFTNYHKITKYTIKLKKIKVMDNTYVTVKMETCALKIAPTIKCHKIMIDITSKDIIKYGLIFFDIIQKSLDDIINENFFLENRNNSLNKELYGSLSITATGEAYYGYSIYVYQQDIYGMTFYLPNPRQPYIFDTSNSNSLINDIDLINFLISSSVIPHKKISIPVSIKKRNYDLKIPYDDLHQYSVIYRDLVFNNGYEIISKLYNKNTESKIIKFAKYKDIYMDIRKQNKITIYRKKLFQRNKDVYVDFIAEFPFNKGIVDDLGVFIDLINRDPILNKYEWLTASSYIDQETESSYFITIAIHRDIWKQKFKDMTINEGGITPFWTS